MDFLSQKHIFAQLGRKFINGSIIVSSRFIKGVQCPICNWEGYRFVYFGRRKDAQCPRCGSLERHRLLWLYLRDRTGFFVDNLKVLDIAPMNCLQRKFRAMPNLDHVSVDFVGLTVRTTKDGWRALDLL